MKQVEFDIDLVKKIQAGEIKGVIQTKEGKTVRFLGEIKDYVYPLVFAKETESGKKELLDTYTLTGKYSVVFDEHVNDIIIEIEEEQQKSEYQFKPFDKVLVRENDIQEWRCSLFSHNSKNGCGFIAAALYWKQCIPYEGNEHLLGTSDKPKEG